MIKRFLALLLAAVVCFTFFGCSLEEAFIDDSMDTSFGTNHEDESEASSEALVVNVVDVGQGDCIAIKLPNGENMVIDSGGNRGVCDKIKELGIKKIDYLVATHPHADHIGRMADILRNFKVDRFYMPKVTNDTKQFEMMLEALKEKDMKATKAFSDVEIINKSGVRACFLAPNSDSYKDLNDYSAVVYLTYGDCSFLFMGDAMSTSEQEILEKYNFSADFIKIGHHGSSSSSTPEFIKTVDPEYAVISCGKDNDYGHPHHETIETLEDNDVRVYRTDKDGTVIAVCDGENIEIR